MCIRVPLLVVTALIALPAAGNDETATFQVELDLGKDRGQSFGSVFEARNAAGRVVAGAGFQDVYNTRFRSDRHTIQFFVRPDCDDRFSVTRLAHPDLGCGAYLFDLDEQVYAWSSVRNDSVRRWDEASGAWRPELPPHSGQIRSGDGVMRLGTGYLAFTGNEVRYDDRVILAEPAVGGYYSFYYAQGRLLFYHRNRTEPGSFTRIYACPWSPDDENGVDLSKAVVLKTKYDLETPFAWGQFDDQVLTVSNMGGIYVFEDSEWRTVLEALDTESYQVYSMLHWHDRLLLAQYPTGNLFEYQGREAKRIEGWPPRLPEVSPSARECQTLSIYRGDLLAGVWPWAELWRYDRDRERWHSMGRMFTHPDLTDASVHPYETEAQKYGLVTNHWGQRVTGLIPLGDSVFVSTSAKGTYPWDDRYTFLTDGQRREYGSVLRLRMPGNLAAQIEWKGQPIQLAFSVGPDRLTILQDGKELAAAALERGFTADLSGLSVTWGQGIFGPLRGELTSRECSVK
ncbi:MAG: hypothetical protein HQ582_33420 [Planctomycetes bacterium]|nr:hypothetical protein [Planctomycetota bacterium]